VLQRGKKDQRSLACSHSAWNRMEFFEMVCFPVFVEEIETNVPDFIVVFWPTTSKSQRPCSKFKTLWKVLTIVEKPVVHVV